VRTLVVVEDDEDVQLLIETAFSLDSRFTVAGVSATAEGAFEVVQTNEPGTIVLDDGLAGRLTGLEAAQKFKDVAPKSKVILFTAHAELRAAAAADPAIDAFVLKTDSAHLLRVAQQLLGMAGSAS
jgi:DNA-binding NarL/FixJ family response regulator